MDTKHHPLEDWAPGTIDDLPYEDAPTQEAELPVRSLASATPIPSARSVAPVGGITVMPAYELVDDLGEDPLTLEVERGHLGEHPPQDLAEMIWELGEAITLAPTLENACHKALELLLGFVPATNGAVLTAGLNDAGPRYVALQGPGAHDALGTQLTFGRGVVGRCLDQGTAGVVRAEHMDPRELDAIAAVIGYRPGAMLVVPVFDDAGNTHGCLQLLDGAFQPWHVQAALDVAVALASRLEAGLQG